MFHRQPAVFYCICMGVGVLGSRVPFFSDAEESLGLHVLYLLRGPEPSRADVVVVAIDYKSANALNLRICHAVGHCIPLTLYRISASDTRSNQ